MEAMTALPQDVQDHWAAIGPLLSIQTEHDYDVAVERLNELLDLVGTNEAHPLYGLLDTLGTVLRSYEEAQIPMPRCSNVDVLQFLMEEHRITASDLPELGSEKEVLELLQNQREMDLRQIRALADRFHVSPAVFI
jgi:HTH-type transcriptional regulator / antitoxin HigA